MSLTKRSDLVVPELLTEAIQGEFAKMRALFGTDAAVINSSMPSHGATGVKLKGGDRIKIPYFGNLGALEDLANEGDALTPVTLTMSDEESVVRHSGKAVEVTTWAQMAAAYADPYGEAARQFRVMVERRVDQALIDVAVDSLGAPNIHDVSGTTTMTWPTVVDARALLGDEGFQNDIACFVVHSKVYGDMLKEVDQQDRPLMVNIATLELPRYAGIPVIVSDKMTVTAGSPDTYDSLIVKKGALAFWYNKTPTVAGDKDILADTEVTAIHMYWAAHRYTRTPGNTKTGVIKIVSR